MKKNKLIIILLLLIPMLFLTGCNNLEGKKETSTLDKVKIIIIDENQKELYNKEIETDKKYLIDVLKDNEDMKLKYEDSGYGAYITSLVGIDQKTEKKGMYYWGYYIDNEYAQNGVSSCEIKNGSTYKFVYEYYES